MATTSDWPITERQQEVLDFIVAHLKECGFPPTVRDIMDAFGFGSPNAVMCHLKALEAKGYIERWVNCARGIRLIGRCPCCGK